VIILIVRTLAQPLDSYVRCLPPLSLKSKCAGRVEPHSCRIIEIQNSGTLKSGITGKDGEVVIGLANGSLWKRRLGKGG
jgi:hypothetical protein